MTDTVDLHFLDENTLVPFTDLLGASGLAMELLVELVEYGVFEPAHASERALVPAQWRVTSRALFVARRASRLHVDFGLDAAGIALALSLMDRIEDLERRLHDLQCQLPREPR